MDLQRNQHNRATPAAAQLAIVVVTHNRQDRLLNTLRQLRSLEEPFPIVVVDNASTDTTVEAVRQQFPQVRLVTLNQNIGAVARNYGVRLVDQRYIAFADDDSWWGHGSLSQAIRCFEQHPRLGLIMSRILVGPEERVDPCCELMQHSPLPNLGELPGIPILGFVACGAVIRRSAFLEVNGFNQRLGTTGEEALLAIDLAQHGWGLAYIDSIVSHHHPSKVRDVRARQINAVRDHLWTAWLRRSPRHVLQTTLRHLRRAFTNRVMLLGILQAAGGIPWVIRARAAIAPELERQLEMLEEQQQAS